MEVVFSTKKTGRAKAKATTAVAAKNRCLDFSGFCFSDSLDIDTYSADRWTATDAAADEDLPGVGGGSGDSNHQGTRRDVSSPINTASSPTRTLSAEWGDPITDDSRPQRRRAPSLQEDGYATVAQEKRGWPGARAAQRAPRKKRGKVKARGKANESDSKGRFTSPSRPGAVGGVADGQRRRGRMFTAD